MAWTGWVVVQRVHVEIYSHNHSVCACMDLHKCIFLQYFIQNNMIYDPEYVFYDIRVSHYKSNMLLECSLFTRRVSCSLHPILHCVTFSLLSHILICIFLYFSNLCFVTECSSRCPYNRSPSSQNHVRSRQDVLSFCPHIPPPNERMSSSVINDSILLVEAINYTQLFKDREGALNKPKLGYHIMKYLFLYMVLWQSTIYKCTFMIIGAIIIDAYLQKGQETKVLLERLVSAGKNLFLITNSGFPFM